MLVLNNNTVRDLLAKAIEVKGADHVQRECVNVERDFDNDEVILGPGCIVGTLLYVGGIPLSQIPEGGSETTLNQLEGQGLVKTSQAAREMLAKAQLAQDGKGSAAPGEDLKWYNKSTWGEAAKIALSRKTRSEVARNVG